MDKKKGLFAAALTILLSSLLCLGLYHLDNKYTKEDIHPINGILFYPEETNLCYLIRQWLLYPDVLLTPEDVDNYSDYRYYQDIGGRNVYSENESLQGSMTYRLTLLLPDEMQEYALELPEVFSACKLYINDRLLLQLGDPTPEHYQEKLGSQIITFSAAGKTELLLAVSNFSGINQGLTYPPAFGTAAAVLAAREGRILLHGGLTLFALLGVLLAISFGMRENKQKGILTGLLCLSLSVVTGYPLYHGLLITGVQPWYTMEPACYYALLFLALLLQCTIYELNLRHRLLLTIPCMAGLFITLIRFGGAALLPEGTAQIFSWVSMGLKYYTAICLPGLSLWALWRKKCHSVLLLGGSSALAACLIWDRLLPLYEPIYGGWLGEIGGILLTVSLITALWMDAVDAYRFRLSYETSLYQMKQRLALQREHYEQLSQQVQLVRESIHDLRHHMRTMRGLAEQDQWTRLRNYLEEYEVHVKERDITIWSDHPIADAVLGYYAAAASELNASYDVRFAVSPKMPFPDDELCIVLGNLLENAIDAVACQKDGSRQIYLRGESADGHLVIAADNTFDGQLHQKNGVYLSTKHPGPGLGLNSITTIAEKYGGLADFSAEKGVFRASIFIPLSHHKGN